MDSWDGCHRFVVAWCNTHSNYRPVVLEPGVDVAAVADFVPDCRVNRNGCHCE